MMNASGTQEWRRMIKREEETKGRREKGKNSREMIRVEELPLHARSDNNASHAPHATHDAGAQERRNAGAQERRD